MEAADDAADGRNNCFNQFNQLILISKLLFQCIMQNRVRDFIKFTIHSDLN